MKVGLTNIELNIVIPGLIPGDGDLLEAGVRRLLGVGEGGVHDLCCCCWILVSFCLLLFTSGAAVVIDAITCCWTRLVVVCSLLLFPLCSILVVAECCCAPVSTVELAVLAAGYSQLPHCQPFSIIPPPVHCKKCQWINFLNF